MTDWTPRKDEWDQMRESVKETRSDTHDLKLMVSQFLEREKYSQDATRAAQETANQALSLARENRTEIRIIKESRGANGHFSEKWVDWAMKIGGVFVVLAVGALFARGFL